MICRTDPRVKEEHNLRNSRRRPKKPAHYEYSDFDNSPSRSCLTIPGINNHKRTGRSHVAMGSNDSTATDSFRSVQVSHSTNPLLNKSNKITNDWYMDDASVESSQPGPERVNLADINPPPVEAMPNLLQLPISPMERDVAPKQKSYQQFQNRHTRPAVRNGALHQHQTEESDILVNGIPELPETPTKNAKSGYSVVSELTAVTPPSARYSQPTPYRRPYTVNYSSDTQDRLEMIQNNIAEIVQEDQERQPASSPPLNNLAASTSGMGASQSLASSKERSIESYRSSAPVDLDDSSFTDPIQHVKGIHAMAMENVFRGEYEMALEAFEQVLQVYLRQYGRAHALTASSYHNLGTVHAKRAGLAPSNSAEQQRCREQALLCFQSAARSTRDTPELGPTHPNVAVSLVRIGFLLLQTKQYQNAVVTFGEALRIRKLHYGHYHPLVANLFNNLGVCQMHLQEFSEGRRDLQEALDIQRHLLPKYPSDTAMLEVADTLCNIGGLCLEWIRQEGPRSESTTDAERSFAEALKIRTDILGEQHSSTDQVRDLLDLARSFPTTSSRETNNIQAPRSPGGRSTATTAIHTNVAPRPMYPRYNIPIMNSTSLAQEHQLVSPEGPTNSKNLQMPSLHSSFSKIDAASKTFGQFEKKSPVVGSMAHTQFGASIVSNSYDTQRSNEEQRLIETEENCLLRPERSGESSRLITYAEATFEHSTSSKKKEDRSALLKNARAILNNQSDSPLRTLGASQMSMPAPLASLAGIKSHDEGLAPLGGNWPESSNTRITPGVLENPDRHLNTIYRCATNFLKRGKYVEALHLLELVAECQRNRYGTMHEDVAAAVFNIGICHLRMNQYYNAMQSFEETTRIRQSVAGPDSPQVAASLVKIGVSLLQLKRLEDSVWIFREALRVRETALGDLHPLTARVYNNIGCVNTELQQFDQAVEDFESALKIQRNVLSHNPRNGPSLFALATTLQNLGFMHQKRGKHRKAVDALTEAVKFQERVLGPSHATVLETLDTIAEASLVGADTSMALTYYKQVLGRLDSSHGAIHEAKTLYKISRVNLQNNELESQMHRLRMALKVLEADSSTRNSRERVELEQLIRKDLNTSREMVAKQKWV